ncbi:predicted protein, partial [Nematostella vectensis]
DGWWGKGDAKKPDDPTIHEHKISIHKDELVELWQRLTKTRFFDTLEGIEWQYGTNQEYMRSLVKYWMEEYDWQKQESLLNSEPNYYTEIEGLRVHFQHIKPDIQKGQEIIPIVLIHGWPGSYFEFYKAIKILKDASKKGPFAYEIICPSIPGYGFSEAPHKPGFNVYAAARVFHKLMERLGHKSYYIQGGDWGSMIGRCMAQIAPSCVRGLHINMIGMIAPRGIWSYILGYFTLPAKEHQKIFPLMDFYIYILRESGYMHLQATRPDTVGAGLNDSPAGLASYIIEKFSVWSGCHTNQSAQCLESRFTKDELLTNVMIYWLTNSITSSMRFYKENCLTAHDVNAIQEVVPVGLADFPDEIIHLPQPWLSATFIDIIQHTEMPRGGHFAALQEPELLAQDVMEFVRKVETRKSSKEEL